VTAVTAESGVHEKGALSLSDMIDRTRSKPDFRKAGAIATFIGVVRGETNEGEKVQKLVLEAYEEKANEVLTEICSDLKKRPGIVDVQIHHLLGEFSVGEDLVYVSVAGSHRPEVFSVLREAVERYKHEAPVFKKEQVVDKEGSTRDSWVSEKEAK
jgi:molybdopterin synthase catalytic subunit